MRRFAAGLGLLILAASPMTAQSLSLSPHIGIYIPTENLYKLTTGGASSSDFQLEAGPSIGARLGLWFGSRFGIEASGSYVPTTFKLTGTSNGEPVKQDAKLFLGSGQLVFFLIPRTSPLSVYVSGGVGLVSRGGIAFTSQEKTRDVGGALGAGAGIRLGPIMLTAGVDFLTYNAAYQSGTLISEDIRQKDFNVKVGLGIPFGGGGGTMRR